MTTLAVPTSRRSYLKADDNDATSYASIGAIVFAVALALLLTFQTIAGHPDMARRGNRCRRCETECECEELTEAND